MTGLRLIGSLTSPYVRFVRVALAEMELDYAFDPTLPFGRMTREQERGINDANPLMKVPVLDTPGGPLFDSRVIVEWLIQAHARPGGFGHGFPENLARQNTMTTVYGVLEAGVLRFILAGQHPELDMQAGYMARSLKRIGHALDWLETSDAVGPEFGPPEALLICCLEWMQRRNVFDVTGYPSLTALRRRHEDRPALLGTRIPDDA